MNPSLLDNGADPDIKDMTGQTALQVAKNKDIEKLLLKAGATTNVDDDNDNN